MIEIKEIEQNTYSIVVPRGIRYISDWSDYRIFPYNHIVDKQIPGCGFTEFCIRNDQNLVLCSPRKLLLENKYDQHKDEVYYVISNYEEQVVDKDLNKIPKETGNLFKDLIREKAEKERREKEKEENERKKKEYYESLKTGIHEYIQRRNAEGKPFKILVTYDSFYLVKNILLEWGVLGVTQIVVDEWQSIFIDATFKPTTENAFVDCLLSITSPICFVSATPMIEKYLRRLDIFKTIPYYEFDWVSGDKYRVKRPKLDVRLSNSVLTTAKKIIQSYLDGKFEGRYVRNEETGVVDYIESKEAVFYLNSVNSILKIIKKMGLRPDQVNILCARNSENSKRINDTLNVLKGPDGKKYNFQLGKIPLEGEQHKMFTFCTRTVYLGADFYSTNARTFVLSDANLETLMVDISLDLPQILGRQRLKSNPWHNEAKFYYKPICDGKKMGKKEFDAIIESKTQETLGLLDSISTTSDWAKGSVLTNNERSVKKFNYRYNYLSINREYSDQESFIRTAKFNDLVRISEERAFDIQQIDYADRFSVFNEILELGEIKGDDKKITDFFSIFEGLPTLGKKLRFYVEYSCDPETKKLIYHQINEKHFHEYIDALGEDGVKACGYNITDINNQLGIVSFNPNNLKMEIYKEFHEGDIISKAEIKTRLVQLYMRVGYGKAAKANDMEDWFENTKTTKTKDASGKWVHAFELGKKKGGN